MAFTIISADLTSEFVVSSNDKVSLLDGVSITSTIGHGFSVLNNFQTDVDLHIAGGIVSLLTAINLAADSLGDASGNGSHDVFIAQTGSAVSFNGHAIQMNGIGNILTNYGELTAISSGAVGVLNNGDLFSMRNYGSISGGIGMFLSVSDSSTAFAALENIGTIQGEGMGIYSYVQFELNNSGYIGASDDDLASYGILVESSDSSDSTVITNTGVIVGQSYAVFFGSSSNHVINSGRLVGDVQFDSGANIYDGRGGTIDGVVYGGSGDDTYYIDNSDIKLVEDAASGSDTVNASVGYRLGDNFEDLILLGDANIRGVGNALNNTITGNIGANRLVGKTGDDTLLGMEGDDLLLGQAGNDTLYGDSGDDHIRGGSGADFLYGGDGNDVLTGGRSDDVLKGNEGDDILFGGLGEDYYYGGTGADIFVFSRAAVSRISPGNDVIKDFTQGDDLVDLSGLARNLTYIGAVGFSGTASEVRVTTTNSGHSIIRADVDGNGAADFKVKVEGFNAMLESDFIL